MLRFLLALAVLLSFVSAPAPALAAKAKAKPKKAAAAKPAGPTLFTRLGGMPSIEALVGNVLKRALKDPRIKEYFEGADLGQLTERLEQFACAATGGICIYEGRSMKETHSDMWVTNAAYDALLEQILFTLR